MSVSEQWRFASGDKTYTPVAGAAEKRLPMVSRSRGSFRAHWSSTTRISRASRACVVDGQLRCWTRARCQIQGWSVSSDRCRLGSCWLWRRPTNHSDTYDPRKGYLTCDAETDDTGKFLFRLLKSIGLTPDDAVLANTVQCLPRSQAFRPSCRDGTEAELRRVLGWPVRHCAPPCRHRLW
jgi:hypothetical protein